LPQTGRAINRPARAYLAGNRLAARAVPPLRHPSIPAASSRSLTMSNLFLRRVLGADALASGATGLLMAAAAQPLAGLTGLPVGLTQPAGLFLIGYAAAVAWLAARPQPPRGLVWTVVALNLIWAVESVMLPLLGWISPTPLGLAFVIGQAVVVAVFAELQFIGLRRTRAAAA
jgi:hypothetical protein